MRMVSPLVKLFGKNQRGGCIGGGVPLAVGFEISKAHFIPN